MLAIVTNHGKTRSFPTCVGNLRIITGDELPTTNPKLIEEMKKFHLIEVEMVEEEQKPKQKKDIDYSSYRITELKSVAAALGISDSITMDKSTLIKRIKETDNER